MSTLRACTLREGEVNQDEPWTSQVRKTLPGSWRRRGRFGILVILAHALDPWIPRWRIGHHPFGMLRQSLFTLPVLEQHIGFGPQRAAKHFELNAARLVHHPFAALGGFGHSLIGNLRGISDELDDQSHTTHRSKILPFPGISENAYPILMRHLLEVR